MKPISLQKTPEHTETQILQRNECIITGENDTWGLGTEIFYPFGLVIENKPKKLYFWQP